MNIDILKSDEIYEINYLYSMEAMQLEILDPGALKLIEGMQDLNLIKIHTTSKITAEVFLEQMRRNTGTAPAPEEIAKIVDAVRAKRYAKK